MASPYDQAALEPIVKGICKTWKNVLLLGLLLCSILSVLAGLNCESLISTYELHSGVCYSLLERFEATHLSYAGGALIFGFCCCPRRAARS